MWNYVSTYTLKNSVNNLIVYSLSLTDANSLIECIESSGAPISITGIVNNDDVIGPIVVPPLTSDLLKNFW